MHVLNKLCDPNTNKQACLVAPWGAAWRGGVTYALEKSPFSIYISSAESKEAAQHLQRMGPTVSGILGAFLLHHRHLSSLSPSANQVLETKLSL